jgi:hypothetical protein
MTIARRRPTPEQAEHLLQAMLATNHQLRDYHKRRAAGLCAYGCGASSLMAYCNDCRPIRSVKHKVWRERRVA